MAGKSVLLLYLNLGGEMVYILAHRLQAQKIDKRKSMESTFYNSLTRYSISFVIRFYFLLQCLQKLSLSG